MPNLDPILKKGLRNIAKLPLDSGGGHGKNADIHMVYFA